MERNKSTVIKVERRKINDERSSDPGYKEADIFLSPVDILIRDGKVVGKVGYSDERGNDNYQANLAELVTRTPKGKFLLKTVSTEVAQQLDLVTKSIAIDIPPLGSDQ